MSRIQDLLSGREQEIDYEKAMKRDELRKKLEARKKISLSKSKIESDLREARRK